MFVYLQCVKEVNVPNSVGIVLPENNSKPASILRTFPSSSHVTPSKSQSSLKVVKNEGGFVGLIVGAIEGKFVGFIVGAIKGDVEGSNDGKIEGKFVGLIVGAIEGKFVDLIAGIIEVDIEGSNDGRVGKNRFSTAT